VSEATETTAIETTATEAPTVDPVPSMTDRELLEAVYRQQAQVLAIAEATAAAVAQFGQMAEGVLSGGLGGVLGLLGGRK